MTQIEFDTDTWAPHDQLESLQDTLETLRSKAAEIKKGALKTLNDWRVHQIPADFKVSAITIEEDGVSIVPALPTVTSDEAIPVGILTDRLYELQYFESASQRPPTVASGGLKGVFEHATRTAAKISAIREHAFVDGITVSAEPGFVRGRDLADHLADPTTTDITYDGPHGKSTARCVLEMNKLYRLPELHMA